MLIDELLPTYDTVERHHIQIYAPAHIVFEAVRQLDLSGSRVVRLLFRLRELPGRFRGSRATTRRLGLTLQNLIDNGFILLGERPDEEIVLGLAGRFWSVSGNIKRINAEEFKAFALAGFAKAVWNFSLSEGEGGSTRLATETRVLCLDDTSRRRFKLYWTLIAPFSGVIRKQALRAVKRSAETNTTACGGCGPVPTRPD
ncbi:MAG TPA: hypothetical protein VNS63_26715 [Blastocatellia bacterium]|nr:hypothetical protein [Blastocatellia bacterium]